MKSDKGTAYGIAAALAVATALFLVWGALAMGILGAEGDPADRMYLGVLTVGIIGAVVARFQAEGMARALVAMALAQVVVVVIALIIGKQDSPVSSVFEIVWLNGSFVALFLGSAWLFRSAARRQPSAGVRSGGSPAPGR